MRGANYLLMLFLIASVLFIWIGVLVRLIGAIFSTRIRKLVAARPLLHYIWALVALLLAAAVLWPPINSSPRKSPVAQAMWTLARLETGCKGYRLAYESFPAGDNAAIARALSGANPRKANFLNFTSQDLNTSGEVIDPWGTPYKFELQDGKPPSIRSAGPDRIFGDEDDLVTPKSEDHAAKVP
jgi:Type II secretion system (T2SS), protein G